MLSTSQVVVEYYENELVLAVEKGLGSSAIVGIVLGCVVLLVIASIGLGKFYMRRNKSYLSEEAPLLQTEQ